VRANPDPADPRLVARLVAWARRLADRDACGPVAVLSHRTGELVLRAGGVVVKAHAPGVDLADLRPRLALAERLDGVMLAPLAGAALGGRTVTLWPAGTALPRYRICSCCSTWNSGAATAPPPDTESPKTSASTNAPSAAAETAHWRRSARPVPHT